MPNEQELRADVDRLSKELDARAKRARLLESYADNDDPPIPEAVTAAKATKAYKLLMGLARTDWPRLIVDSVAERLEVQGIRFDDKASDDEAWEIWQDNGLDADADMIHEAALTTGRAFVIVWGNGNGKVEIVPEDSSTTIVDYFPGSRRMRRAGLRRWCDDKKWYATLYLPDGLYKFEAVKNTAEAAAPTQNTEWKRRDVNRETWPLKNSLGEVNVVEFAVNRRLRQRSSTLGSAAGEFESALGHLDRINYSVFSGLVAMTWSGFPLRALIGDPILRDDDGNPLKPFDVAADKLVQIENPEGKLVQLPEAKLENYLKATEEHIRHLAATTKTPAHYFLGQMVNVSADAIRAADAGLVSKSRRHSRHLGEAWEDVSRLALRVKDPKHPRATSKAEIIWADLESRSMAERADAATKLKDILPWQALAQKVLNASPQEISRWEAMLNGDAIDKLIAAAAAGDGPVPPA